LLSDGRSEDGDFRGIARSIRAAGMTLTSVAVGDDADIPMMKMLADIGGGRFYATDRPDNLPRIFTREASLASRSTIIEEPFTPRLVRPTQATNGIDWSAAPQLGGYVGTAERDSLQSPAITSLISDKDDPVYAVWQYGLGRAAAFTSDAKPQWAAGWMNWSGFGGFWTQAFRDTLRSRSANDLIPRVEIGVGRGHVSVEATTPEGAFKNNLHLRTHVIAPDLSTTDITLDQTASGRYEGDFAAVARGAYLVTVSEADGQSATTAGAVNSYSPEFNITSTDADLSARISEATGGRSLALQARDHSSSELAGTSSADADVDLFERRTSKTKPHEIWATLLLAALLLLPIDVGLRRVHITREQIARALARLRSRFQRARPTEVDAEAAAALAQLKNARARVRLGDEQTERTSINAQESPAPVPARESHAAGSRRKSSEEEGPAAAEAQSLASRLLDARRNRRP
jgi:hypothetical protein